MKSLLAYLLAMGLATASFAKESDSFTPAIGLEDALTIAKQYVTETSVVQPSKYYLKSVELKFDEDGKSHHWEAQWMSKSIDTKGDWFIVRVEMDKKAGLIRGK